MIPQGTSYYLLTNVASGRVIDGMNNGRLGSQLQTNDSKGWSPNNDQLWAIIPRGDGTFNIKDQHVGNYAGVGPNGTAVQLVAPNNTVCWAIIGSPTACQIVEPTTGRCLTDQGGNIIVASPDGAVGQLWSAIPVMQSMTPYQDWRTTDSGVNSSVLGSDYTIGELLNLIAVSAQKAVAQGTELPAGLTDCIDYWRLYYDGVCLPPGGTAAALLANIVAAFNSLSTGDWATVNTNLSPTGYTAETR